MRDDKRPFDWILDIVAPTIGAIIGLSIFSVVAQIAGCM
jgi:hypothetical protein